MSRELERMRKQSAQKVEAAKRAVQESKAPLVHNLDQMIAEEQRVSELSRSAAVVIHDLERDFQQATKLTKVDVAFLFLATALQCARQYLLTNDKFRLQDKGSLSSSDRGDRLMEGLYGNTVGKIAPPTWEEILFQSVPYDATGQSIHVKNKTGLSGANHRFRTLGHDPVLGWVFGTANIMTNSLTKFDLETYQVKNHMIIRHYPLGVSGMFQRAISYAEKDSALLAAAVARQAIHFGSDYFTKQGLPLPFIASVNNDLAKTMLTEWNVNTWSVTRGMTLAALINLLVAHIHKLFYDKERDGSPERYEVRTRKILSYSNIIATGSNVVVVAFTKNMNLLDVGGIAVTLYRLIADQKFIDEVKRDFLKNELYTLITGPQYDFMGGL